MKKQSEPQITGGQVITACACVYTQSADGYKILLMQRAESKKFLPNVYELLGGHIEYGETLEEGLKREIREEVEREVMIEMVCGAFTYVNQIKNVHAVEVVYLARFVDGKTDVVLNPEDHQAYVWVSEDELPRYYAQGDLEGEVVRQAFSCLLRK